MPVTEVEHVSEASSGSTWKNILLGGLLFLVSFPLLFWNEGRAIKRARTLSEGAGAVLSGVPTDQVDSGNDQQLVHMTGEATAEGTLVDEAFGVSAENAIKLRRKVEMCQWQENEETETKKTSGGKTKKVTTYSYERVWSESPIDSSDFHPKGEGEYGEGNPPMPYSSETFTAPKVALGAFTLSPGLVGEIKEYQPLKVGDDALAALPEDQRDLWKLHDDGLYQGEDVEDPQVGDMKVHFEMVPATTISLIAQQTGETFQPYQAASGEGSIELLQVGKHSSKAMFEEALAENASLTWFLRGLGFALMAMGIYMVPQPLYRLADVVPVLGSTFRAGIALVAFLVAAVLSLVTIAIGWLFYRPLIGVSLLAAAAVIVAIAVVLIRNRKAAASSA